MEQCLWMLVDDHIANFNKNRARNYHPSYSIYVDESMPIWYGIGGPWINDGFPQYITIDRNPENGCEIHNAPDESFWHNDAVESCQDFLWRISPFS